MDKRETLLFCMELLQDKIDDELKLIVETLKPNDLIISKSYIEWLKEHIGNLEDIRRELDKWHH